MMRPRILGAALVFSLMASNATATLIELDLFEEGDGLITYDSETGFEWLDLSFTKARSYNDVAADESLQTLGFSHGNTKEVERLLQNGSVLSDPDVEDAQLFINLISETADSFPGTGIVSFANGIHERVPASNEFISYLGIAIVEEELGERIAQTTSTVNDEFTSRKNFEPTFSGHWLVRQVPEPGTFGLLAVGVLGVVLSKRRRRI